MAKCEDYMKWLPFIHMYAFKQTTVSGPVENKGRNSL